MSESAKSKEEQLKEIGKNAYESIREMVAALECDYDRLEELKAEREELADAEKEARENYVAYGMAEEGDEEADAIETALEEAEEALKEWDEDNADELKELTEAAGDCEDREDAEQRIMEDPLSLQFRSGWCQSKDDMVPEEFELLLATGGPAVRIIGELDEHQQPDRAWLEVQDWFTPWTRYFEADQDVLLTYCRCFCFEY